MKKPVLLLLDDDPVVREALESELEPEFASVLRIESFGGADELRAALPRWRSEERPIAVAVVDQRMPGSTGVELLREIRVAARQDPGHPAAHLHSILLTGYAGLDSAMAAKNESGVFRYLEKPWSSRELAGAVRGGLHGYLVQSGRGLYAEFRAATGEEELQAVLALRSSVYRRTQGVSRLTPESSDLDVDEFDPIAEQFGLFACGPVEERVVGALRISGSTASRALAALRAVVRGRVELEARLDAPRTEELPLLKYLEDADAVRVLLAGMKERGERCVEPGRLVLEETHRAGVPGQERHLARLILDGAVAHAFFLESIEHALLTCVPAHSLFYRPYGFREAEGTSARYQRALDVPLGCHHGRPDWVPESARARCTTLAARMRRTGGACRCQAFPECAGGSYESGRFESVDLFCPALARSVSSGHTSANDGGSSDVP